jgi:predicted HTH transcriptional regulator
MTSKGALDATDGQPIVRIMANFETEADLKQLLDNEVPEGILVEYKSELYGESSSDKREFLKDISSFANTVGGHLFIGVAASGGVPNGLPGLDADLDKEVQRFENLLRDRIEPRIVGTRIWRVPLSNGRPALVIRIPRSWNPPHAVVHNDARLIFARNSAGVHHASVDEMRSMFINGRDPTGAIPRISAAAHGRNPFWRGSGASLIHW